MANDEASVEIRRSKIITVEQAAYLAVGLLAAALRWFQLGLRPLNESEAVQALAALRFTQGGIEATPAGTIPALFTGNVAGFGLMGASDITARWLPALVGLILVLLPYWLRHRLGRGGALAAALLLALSPSAVHFSRVLDGAMVVAACGLAMAVGLINYVDGRRPSSLYMTATALGLGLCAGPATLSLVLIVAAFGPLLYLSEQLLDRETGWSSLTAAWSAVRGERGLLARVGAVLAGSFALAATTFVLHPAGIGQAADLIANWARGFLPKMDGQPALYPLLLLLRYEPLILLLGVVEMGRAVASSRAGQEWAGAAPQSGSSFSHTALLTFWAGAAVSVVLVSGHRPAGNVLLVVVPMALLAGQGIERAWHWLSRRTRWQEAGLVALAALGLLVFFYLQMAAYSRASSTTTVSVGGLTMYTASTHLLLASVVLLLLIALGAAAWYWRGLGVMVGGGWLAVLVALGLFGFKATWGLNFAHAADSRELMLVQTTAPDVRVLVERLEALSLAQAGDAHTLPVTVDAATGPVVAWYLREFHRQTVVESLSTPPDTAAAVTLAMQEPPIGETFRGRGFPLRTHGLPWGLWGQSLVRWLLFNEGTTPVVDQEVVLWVASQP
jgi:uncharacterized protein (TIGR03663 family)